MHDDKQPVSDGGSSTRAASLRPHLPWCLALLLLLLPVHGRLLFGDDGAIGRDYGVLFLDALTQQREALLDGRVLLWDASQVGGTAFWPLPNQAPLYPPLMACLLLRGAIGGLNLCLFLHVAWGALGTYVLVYHLGRRRFAALVGGLLFAHAHFTRQLADILPLEALAGAWIPWAMYGLCRAQDSPRWWRWSALAGVAYAGVAWLGGFIQFLPGLLVLGTVLLVSALRRSPAERLRRAAASFFVFGCVMSLVAAGKLLPLWHWIPLTDRSGGIDENFALGGSLSADEMLAWTVNEGWVPLVLALTGVILALRRRSTWLLSFAVAIVLLLLIADGPLYAVLYEWLPGFRYVREPRRVWLLMPAVLPVAAGLGVALAQDAFRPSRPRALLAASALLAVLAADLVVWPRYEPPIRRSLSASLIANRIHQDLARRAGSEPRFRCIAWDKCRARLKQTADLVRSSLGLESVEGILGNVAITAYDIDYLNVARDSRARLLGLMNCRYVLSTTLLDEPGLSFVKTFAEDYRRPYKGIDGPHLYRNELALPRASLAGHALLQVGGGAALQSELLRRHCWDPQRTALIRAEADAVSALDDAELRLFDGAIFGAAGHGALRTRLQAAGVDCFVAAGTSALERLDWLLGMTRRAKAPLRTLPDPARSWNEAVVRIPEAALGGNGSLLLLAETFALYPGWSARIDGKPAPMFLANAVTTAVALPPGAREVRFDYTPPGLWAGLGLTAAGLLLAAALVVLSGPPRRPLRAA